MNVRQIDLDTEYDALCAWWTSRLLVPPSKIILEAGTGFIVQNNGQDIAAGWLFISVKGIVGWVEWAISNPDVSDVYSTGIALSQLYDFFESWAKDCGCSVLFTSTQDKGPLRRFLEKRHWQFCEGPPHVHLLKVIRTKE